MMKAAEPNISTNLISDVEAIDRVMLRLSWAARKQLAQELEQYNLTVPQYVTLRALRGAPAGCTMRELAEAAQQLSPTMTGIADRLDEAGLIRRETDLRDRRSLRVYLTRQGEQLMETLEEQRRSRLITVMSCLEPQERRDLIRLLDRFVNASLDQNQTDIHRSVVNE